MQHNKVILKVLILCLSQILLLSCTTDDNVIPKTENEVFNQLIREAPASIIIDLDGIPVDTVIIRPEHILGTETSPFFSEPVFLGFPVRSIIKVNDSLYVAHSQKIYVMDEEGIWQRSAGRQGRGPGEFAASVNIAINSKYIMALDYWNGRIQVFDHDLNLLFIHNKNLHDPLLWRNFALTDNYLYLGLIPNSNDDLISIYKSDDFENQIETFWPKIIPDGFQPGSYNNIIMDVNNNDNIAITNLGLPYLFLLNPDRGIEQILFFASSVYRELENPSTKPINVKGNTEQDLPGVRNFIQQMIINDDGSIYFTVRYNLYQIVPIKNQYHLKRAWHFVFDDPSIPENSPNSLHITGMLIEDDVLYFVSMYEGYVFRISL